MGIGGMRSFSESERRCEGERGRRTEDGGWKSQQQENVTRRWRE